VVPLCGKAFCPLVDRNGASAGIAWGAAFVILNHDGTVRIERGFIRTEAEKPEPQAEHPADEPSSANVDVEGVDGRVEYADGAAGEDAADEEDNDSPLSDILVRDLTAHRTWD
jgi:ParB family chromosome partitioning protein